jgi:hypothetical protein
MAYFDIKKEYSQEFIDLIRTLKKRPAPKLENDVSILPVLQQKSV